MSDWIDSRYLIRAYSFQAEDRLPPGSDAHGLAHILAEQQGTREDAQDPWRRFFEPFHPSEEARDSNPITQILAVETEQLRERWKKFVESSSAVDRLNLKLSEPSMNGVIATVQEIQRAWESKRSNSRLAKAKRLFHKFCGTLHAHKALIEILPSGNEYVSIFTGTLNAVIQASANHEKIAEDLSEALCVMSQQVDDCKKELQLFDMEDMQALVADLYAHIFLLLSSVMDWMMKKRIKRLLDSFNDDLPGAISNETSKIQAISDRIRNLASQKARAELRSTRLTAESTARDIRAGLEGEKRHQAEMKYFGERMLQEQMRSSNLWITYAEKQRDLSDKIVNMMKENASRWFDTNGSSPTHRQPFHPAILLSLNDPATREYTSEEVSINSRHLEDFFYRDRVRLSCAAFDSLMIPPESFREIGDWARAPAPNLRWLEGPYLDGDDFENPVTMMAETLITLAERTKLPVVSYFCELRRGEELRYGNDTKEAQAMLSLVYALIRQLVELLSPILETSVNLSEEHFKGLDGSLGTWSQATSILADLNGLMPCPVLCIIDSVHWLTDRGTDNYLAELLKVLRGEKWKVLLFTTGRSVVLRDELSRTEVSAIDVQSFGRGVALDRQEFSER